jgi:hypothetical protein
MPETPRQPQGITPSVIIGVGGTGKQVVMRLRKLMTAQYGPVRDFPVVAYLVIDTDSTVDVTTSVVVQDYALTPRELVEATVPNAEAIYQGIEAGHQRHIGEWFDVERLRHIKDFTKGADSIRMAGRLCFFQNYQQIRNRLEEALNQVRLQRNKDMVEERYRDRGMQIDDGGLNIYILGSLAGGTGSGMFLDLAYLCRKLVTRSPNFQCSNIGFLTMPGAFRDTVDSTRKLANGYAALKELSYFMYNGGRGNVSYEFHSDRRFSARYTDGHSPQDGVDFGEEERPFDYCYLMDSTNGVAQLEREDLFEMMARNLHLEFTSQFAQWKARQRTNLRVRITEADPMGCTTNFFSAGISFFYYPVREVCESVVYRLAREAGQAWLGAAAAQVQQRASTERIGEYVDQFLARAGLAEAPARNQRELTRMVGTSEDGQPFPQVANTWKAHISQVRQQQGWEPEATPRNLTEEFRRFAARLEQNTPNIENHGAWARAIAMNGARMEAQYYATVETEVANQVEDPSLGIDYARAFIAALRARMAEVRGLLEEEFRSPAKMAQILGDVTLRNEAPRFNQGLESGLAQEVARAMREVEAASHKLIGRKGATERAADEAVDWAERLNRARLERIIRTQIIQRLGAVDQRLEELDKCVAGVSIFLDQLRRKLGMWEDERKKQTQIQLINGELLYQGDAAGGGTEARYYTLLVPDQRTVIQQIRDLVLRDESLAGPGRQFRLIDLPTAAQTSPDIVDRLLEAIHEQARRHVSTMLEATVRPSAAQELAAACATDDELKQRLRNVYDKSRPFVALGQPMEGGFTRPEDDILVGLPGGGPALLADGNRDAKRIANALYAIGVEQGKIEGLPDSDSHQIIFSQEQGGFPLRAVNGIHHLRAAYEAERGNPRQPPLHLFDRWAMLPDLEPILEQRARDCRKLWYLGCALGIVETGQSANGPYYFISLGEDYGEEVLGRTRADVIATLYRDTRVEETLGRRIRTRFSGGDSGRPTDDDVQAVRTYMRPYVDRHREALRDFGQGTKEEQGRSKELQDVQRAVADWLPDLAGPA